MTETLITVSARAAGERRPGSVGLPLAGVDTRLAGEDGGPVAYDGTTVGELQVRGATLFDGYLGRPDATAAVVHRRRLVPHRRHGGRRAGRHAPHRRPRLHRPDQVRRLPDRRRRGGERAARPPGVREAAVVGAPHPDLGQQIVAYVVADGVDERELIDFVAGHLSVHKRPRIVRFVDCAAAQRHGQAAQEAAPAALGHALAPAPVGPHPAGSGAPGECTCRAANKLPRMAFVVQHHQ